MARDFLPPSSRQETDLLRLELGEDIKQFVDRVEQGGFDCSDATFTFTDPDFVTHTWLPLDIASLLATNQTTVKRVDISYNQESGQSRPGAAVVIYLVNGERITISKAIDEPAKSDFSFDYTDTEDILEPIKSSDVMRLITSLLSPDMSVEQTTMSHLLASDVDESYLDPTHPLLSKLILQLLPQRADAWKREESVDLPIEDDRDTLRIVKTTGTDQDVAKVSFIQNGSEISPESYFEVSATQSADNPEASVSFERSWAEDQVPELGDADKEPHVYDFMKSVVKLATHTLHISSPVTSYEAMAARILRDEDQKEKVDENLD